MAKKKTAKKKTAKKKTTKKKVAKKAGKKTSSKKTAGSKKPGLWANIHKKRERIAHGSGEKMRKKGDKGAPTQESLAHSQS